MEQSHHVKFPSMAICVDPPLWQGEFHNWNHGSFEKLLKKNYIQSLPDNEKWEEINCPCDTLWPQMIMLISMVTCSSKNGSSVSLYRYDMEEDLHLQCDTPIFRSRTWCQCLCCINDGHEGVKNRPSNSYSFSRRQVITITTKVTNITKW